MKLMIAGLENRDGYKHLDVAMKSKYVLSSYYYLKTRRNDKIFMDWIKELNAKNNFVLDSGAFTFMTSQLIDTAIFITIAFWGAVPNLLHMIISQYIVKFILAALDTPFFYFFTRKKGD